MADPQAYPLMDIPSGNAVFQELGGITVNTAKEDMSIAFISGLVAHAGLQTRPPFKHDDGIDLWIGATAAVVNGVSRRNPQVFVQMKSTSHPEIDGDVLTYRFSKRECYESLASLSTVPQALIVYIMPDDRQKWLLADRNHTDFVGHAFFYNMADAPQLGSDDPPKVVVPLANRLTTRSLVMFFEDAVSRHYQ